MKENKMSIVKELNDWILPDNSGKIDARLIQVSTQKSIF